MSGGYQGSQAYPFHTGGNESVNRNTGSVVYSKTLVDLRGVTESINFKLDISYASGQSKILGLPKNWTFSIPFLIPGKSVTTHQRTYAIDFDYKFWFLTSGLINNLTPTRGAEATGYQSGLRYINDHGIKLENALPSQPLPSGRPGQYVW